jgi:hypothetical protein
LHGRGVRQQHLVLDDFNLLEAVLAPAIADPLGEHPIAHGAGDVRFGGQERMGIARPGGSRKGEESILEPALDGRRARSKAEDGGRGLLREHER